MAKPKQKAAEVEETQDESVNDELDILELDQPLEDYEEPELMAPGWYFAEIQTVEVRQNQAGTGSYYAVKFVIPTEKYPPDYDIANWPDGLPLYYNLVRKPRPGDRRAISTLKKFLQQIGRLATGTTIDPNDWVGAQAKIKLVHNTYQGNTREQIAPGGIQSSD